MGEDVIIKAKKLTKVFDGKDVVKEFEIQIFRGSIYGILGPNGAGKTTILKLLTGLISPTSGFVEILGTSYPLQREEILKNIGVLIETPMFYEHLSAKENLEIHLSYMGLKGDIEKALMDVGLFNVESQPVSKFSLGMRQRLGIARTLVHKPKILILDEPLK